MPETVELRFRCPYPTIDDASPEAVAGFGFPGQRVHRAEPAANDTVVSPDAGTLVLNGRCDHTDEWTATGHIVEAPTTDGGFETMVLVRDNAGSCPVCGQPGTAVGGLGRGKLKNATVRLS